MLDVLLAIHTSMEAGGSIVSRSKHVPLPFGVPVSILPLFPQGILRVDFACDLIDKEESKIIWGLIRSCDLTVEGVEACVMAYYGRGGSQKQQTRVPLRVNV